MALKRDFASAKRIAYQLLKFRARSEKEIRDRLKIKGFSPEIITQTVEYLYRLKYLNDREFARAWSNSRITRPLGIRRIVLELRQKGVGSDIIEDTLQEVKKGYNEYEVIMRLAKVKLGKMKNLEKYKAKRRLYAYLMQRGFDAGVINEVMDDLR